MRPNAGGESSLDNSRDVLIVSIAFLLFLFSIFAVSTLLFLIKVPLSGANGLISLLLTLGFVAVEAERKGRAILVTLGVIATTVLLVSFYYDGSWDGNVYHKLCTGLIKTGWNPIYQTFGDFANDSGRFLQYEWDGFYDGYPKASYIIGAGLYAITGTIESSKAFTLLAMLSATGIITVFLREIGRVAWWQSFAVAFFSCVNAVALGSIITSYNDGFLAMLIYIAIFAFLYLAIGTSGQYDRFAYILIFLSASVGVNLKFSALFPFAGIWLMFFALTVFGRVSENRDWLFSRATPARMFTFLSATAFSGVVALGLTSYVRNIYFHRNPLFPVVGANKEDVLAVATPPVFRDVPPIKQFIGSLFSSISHDPKLASIPLKIPFTFDREEVRNSLYWGARAGGWGIFFSGILLLSLLAYVFVARRAGKALNTGFLCVLAISLTPAFLIPGLNMARYWPLPALIPPFVLFLLFATGSISRNATAVAGALLIANVALPVGGLVLATKQSWQAHRQMRQLVAAAATEARPLVISLGAPYLATRENLSKEKSGYRRMHGTEAFNGVIFNLDDAGIRSFDQVRPGDIEKVPGERTAVNFSVGTGSPIGFVYVFTKRPD